MGRVGGVGYEEAGEDPVVEAVFENVGCRHCGVAEAVHEEGFQLAFEEVEGYG